MRRALKVVKAMNAQGITSRRRIALEIGTAEAKRRNERRETKEAES